jgi:hypothetical protein
MLPFFGMSAIVIAALMAPSAPAPADAVNAAPVPVPVAAVAPAEQRRVDQQAVTIKRPATVSEDPRQQQLDLRFVFPALSGDGG